jgi:hypothetical protein
MAKCPKCNKEIDHLKFQQTLLVNFDFYVNESAHYNNEKVVDCFDEGWYCPFCGEKLFDDEDYAINFLRKIKEEVKK